MLTASHLSAVFCAVSPFALLSSARCMRRVDRFRVWAPYARSVGRPATVSPNALKTGVRRRASARWCENIISLY